MHRPQQHQDCEGAQRDVLDLAIMEPLHHRLIDGLDVRAEDIIACEDENHAKCCGELCRAELPGRLVLFSLDLQGCLVKDLEQWLDDIENVGAGVDCIAEIVTIGVQQEVLHQQPRMTIELYCEGVV